MNEFITSILNILKIGFIGIIVFLFFIFIISFKTSSRSETAKKKAPNYPKKLSPDEKGAIGEALLYEELKGNNEKNILKNTYIQERDQSNGSLVKSSEIDIIAVNNSGIHVFESKYYRGNIYGSIDDKTWTQVIGDNSYFMPNPVSQNNSHIKAINKFFKGKYSDKLYSYIVFRESCKLKKIPFDPENFKIIKLGNVYKIKNSLNTNKTNLTDSEVAEIYTALEKVSGENVKLRDKEDHVLYCKKFKYF